jgi:SAM-dependent methyltransferase
MTRARVSCSGVYSRASSQALVSSVKSECVSIPLITGFFYNLLVNHEIASALIRLNHQFYQTFADSFSATRQRIQPGVRRIVSSLPQQINLLDLGCGNGSLADYLARYCFRGSYLGLDFSAGLLQNSRSFDRSSSSSPDLDIRFAQADLSDEKWEVDLPAVLFSQVFSFAVFHHLPGDEMRLSILEKIRRLLAPDGIFILSNWQFMNSARFKERIIPWNFVGLNPVDLEEGDYLLDWRAGPATTGYRYVHSYTSAELHALAGQSGFIIQDEFYSDGKEGNLGLYQVWKPQ